MVSIMSRSTEFGHLPNLQRERADFPHIGVQEDLDRIYNKGEITIGDPQRLQNAFYQHTRDHTVGIIGEMYGDEGKGRIVDNKLAALLENQAVKNAYVIRFQGGNNAGHTLVKEDGTKIALHVVPSGILYEQAVGMIDRGTVVHAEDLLTELTYAENFVGDLRSKVLLSEEAILCTDLERAEETLNKVKSGGNSNGGTGRGISPSYAHHYDRTGTKVYDLMDEGWRETFSTRYERYRDEFAAYGKDLATELVPDFRKEKLRDIHNEPRVVGTQEEYLDRLEEARTKLIERDMVENTYLFHPQIFHDLSKGVLFEGAQALGLHPWLGSYPDVTTSDTSLLGIAAGTGYWMPQNVHYGIGIFKGPYTSTVGKRLLPTDMGLTDTDNTLPENATPNQQRGKRIRDDAGERGTTTGRWRKIAALDLPNLAHNATMSGVNALAATMMDICEETDTIPVCVYYTTKDKKPTPFQPSMRQMKNLVPHYEYLPGWDGEACRKAKILEDLPENALKYLSFIQARTGLPIVAVTTGPSRDALIELPGY